jgi:hypothetical protein
MKLFLTLREIADETLNLYRGHTRQLILLFTMLLTHVGNLQLRNTI